MSLLINQQSFAQNYAALSLPTSGSQQESILAPGGGGTSSPIGPSLGGGSGPCLFNCGSSSAPPVLTPTSTSSSVIPTWLSDLFGNAVGPQLLRLVLLILGLICIAGAIYLYKGVGSSIVTVPINLAKKAVKTGVKAAAENTE